MKKFILITMLLAGSISFAANAKKAKNQTTTTQASSSPAVVAPQKVFNPKLKADLKGLSLFVSYDMVDSIDFSASGGGQSTSGNYNTERAIGFGGQYKFMELDNGIGLHAGGSYEMSRVISSAKTNQGKIEFPGAKPEVQFWVMYAQAEAFLTDRFSVFGGGNYTIPQVKNVPGGSWKGKFGYQVGGSYILTPKMAVDAELRQLAYSGSADNPNGGSTDFDSIKSQGFTFRGRYMF